LQTWKNLQTPSFRRLQKLPINQHKKEQIAFVRVLHVLALALASHALAHVQAEVAIK